MRNDIQNTAVNDADSAAENVAIQNGITRRQVRREKLIYMRERFYGYKATQEIHLALDGLLEFGTVGTKRQSPARCMTLIGPSGSGKTSALQKKYEEVVPYHGENTETGTRTQMREIMYLEVPVKCTLKELSRAILLLLGDEEVIIDRGSSVSLARRVSEMLREHGVKLVILDEFQQMLSQHSRAKRQEVVDYIKQQLNKGHTSFVLAGTEEAMPLFEENDQLLQRSAGHFELLPIDLSDLGSVEFRQAWRILSKALKNAPIPYDLEPFGMKSFEADPTLAVKFLQMGSGLIGRTLSFIYATQTEGIMRDVDCISLELLVSVANIKRPYNARGWVNPFSLKAVKPGLGKSINPDTPTGLSTRAKKPKMDDLVHP